MAPTLPMFPNMLDPELDHVFAPLCQDLPSDQIAGLLRRVSEHVEQVRQALKSNEFLDVSTAEWIASALTDVLIEIDRYPNAKRRLIIGASEYFIRNQDVQTDLGSLIGFDDDVAVLNFMLGEIGRSDLRIEP